MYFLLLFREGYPMYFARIFNYNHPNQSAITKDEAVIYAACLVGISIISVTIQHPFMLAVMHLGMKIRVACMSLLYRKVILVTHIQKYNRKYLFTFL